MKNMPDVQEMDKKYDRYYMVPWPDCQKFDELDDEQTWTIPTYYEGQPVTFVDCDWVKENYYQDD